MTRFQCATWLDPIAFIHSVPQSGSDRVLIGILDAQSTENAKSVEVLVAPTRFIGMESRVER